MLTTAQKIQVLNHLMPDCSRIVDDDEIIWLDARPMPTDAEMEAVWYQINLDERKAKKRVALDNRRDEAFDLGLPWSFGGIDDIVQTREQDRINLIALALAATIAIAVNNTPDEPIVPFRAMSNTDYYLLPAEAIAMALAALQHISDIYQYSWGLKDLIDDCTVVEELDNIVWAWQPPVAPV